MFGQSGAGKPKHVKLDGYAELLGGGVEAWTFLDDALNAISEKHDCTDEEARRLLEKMAMGAQSGTELYGRVLAGADAVPVDTAAA